MNKGKKVFVGVSGGVDSSVALALLQKDGYDVTGVFLKVWSPDFLPCEWRDERRSAMRVCATLGVPFITLDCEKEYKEMVVDYMLSEYKVGRTPNPDVFCNKYVKFGVFLKKALEMGADYVATGHYARVEERIQIEERIKNKELRKNEGESKSSSFVIHNSLFLLREAVDEQKDQSYFLSELGQYELSHTLFPIGHLKKSDVRTYAKEFGLPTAEKKDSQGLCFIGKIDMKDFLRHYIDTKPGDVLNQSGEVIGVHEGAVLYTIGERHGFTITKKTDHDPKFFVIGKDIEKNTITVGSRKEDDIQQKEIKAEKVNWIGGTEPDMNDIYDVRFRYRQTKVKSRLVKDGDIYRIEPQEVQSDVASGQIAVIYRGDVCIGAGIIL